MGVVHHYATLVLFAAGLLFGLQAPNFIDQYEDRIDAQLDNAKNFLAEYVLAADSIHTGDGDDVAAQVGTKPGNFIEMDYQALKDAHGELQRFEIEKGALNAPFMAKAIHILFYADDTILEETIQNYKASIPLTGDAILSGLVGGLALCCIFEVVLSSGLMILKRMREYRASQIDKKLSE